MDKQQLDALEVMYSTGTNRFATTVERENLNIRMRNSLPDLIAAARELEKIRSTPDAYNRKTCDDVRDQVLRDGGTYEEDVVDDLRSCEAALAASQRDLAEAMKIVEAVKSIKWEEAMTYEGNLEAHVYMSVDALNQIRAALNLT